MKRGFPMSDDWTPAWQPAVDVVGQDFSGGVESSAVDAIERATIRRYCEPLEFDCPLHYDEEVAKTHGYKGILAPHSGVSSTWIDAGLWRPSEGTRYPIAHPHVDLPRARGPEMPEPPMPPTTAGFATDIEIEYHEPPVVGDRLTVKGRNLISCLPRETRVGRGAFMIWERQVVNQNGSLVALLRNGGYRYTAFDTPRPSVSAPRLQTVTSADSVDDDLLAIRNVDVGEISSTDWAIQRYFEDIQEGDSVPPITINLTIARLVVEAGANRDFNQIHHNSPISKATGAPEMYANNGFIQGWWERCVREYVGLAGRFKKTGPFRMNIFNVVGETVTTSGEIKRKWEENGEHLVELEIRSEMSQGISVGPGPVVVALPSHGD
jgi:acyl dehydratase